jgi:hypothetical protein
MIGSDETRAGEASHDGGGAPPPPLPPTAPDERATRLRRVPRSATVVSAPVRPTGFTQRIVVIGAVTVGVVLAGAIAVGVLAVPDLAGALEEEASSLGGWIYVAAAVLVFLETTALLGFMIHGELALLLGGVAA